MSDTKAGRIVGGAIVAIYLAFVFVGFAKQERQQDRHSHQQKTQADPGNGAAAKSTVVDVEPNTTPEENPCEQRDGDNWQDLCQQWRMAEAADELASLTKMQIGVTVLEVALLIAVLIYTAKATLANTEANRLSQKALIVEQRPWVKVSDFFAKSPLTWFSDFAQLEIGFTVENVGKTPARNVLVGADVEPRISEVETSDVYKRLVNAARLRPYDMGHTIFPGETLQESKTVEIVIDEEDFRDQVPVLMCVVSYKNPLDGEMHQTGIAVAIQQKTLDRQGIENIGEGMDPRVEPERIKLRLLPAGSLVID